MARNKWSIDGGVLSVDGNVTGTFSLSEVSENWDTLTETEKFLVTYGTKQWLSDKMAGSDVPEHDLLNGWERMKDGDFARKAGASSGITKAQLKKERDALAEELEAARKELEELRAMKAKK